MNRQWNPNLGMDTDMKLIHPTIMTVLVLWCIACPVMIYFMGEAYGSGCPYYEEEYQDLRVNVVDGIAWSAFFATAAVIFLLRHNMSWLLAAIFLVPMLVVTITFAIFCGLWMLGTYF